MGTGKTSAAISLMRGAPFLDIRPPFIFVTQFLDEVRRIRLACPEFVEPVSVGAGKLDNMKTLTRAGLNIASTHALFYRYDQEALELIRNAGYTLILDEVINVIKVLDLSPSDIACLFDAGLIAEGDDHRVQWMRPEYAGRWADVRDDIETSCVTYEDGHLMVWTLPIELFNSFRNVILLTYLFPAQYQQYYFAANNVPYTPIGAERRDGGYFFTETPGEHMQRTRLPGVVVEESPSLLAIGEARTALSSTWFKRATGEQIAEVRNNIYNVMHNRWKVSGSDLIWSTYMHAREAVERKGFKQSFLAYNARATNDWADRHYLAYAVNVFPMPDEITYFRNRGFEIDQDAIATSTMVQWVWRSAIRKGERIWIYLPSRRMKNLFQQWYTGIAL